MKKYWLSHVGAVLVLTLTFSLGSSAAASTAEKLPPGFIAISEGQMKWADAKAFCQQHGGKLPRINNSASWDGKGEATIDGFGARGAPWPSLPFDRYWTGTGTVNPDSSWCVLHQNMKGLPNFNDPQFNFVVPCKSQSRGFRAVCVPK